MRCYAGSRVALVSYRLVLINCVLIARFFSDTRRYFSPVEAEASRREYARTIAKFLRVVLKSLDHDLVRNLLPDLTRLKKKIEGAMQSLLTEERNQNGSEDITCSLHELLFSLYRRRTPSISDADCLWHDVVLCYLAIASIKPDGGFWSPSDLTPHLARFKYSIRLSVILHASINKPDEEYMQEQRQQAADSGKPAPVLHSLIE